MFDPDRLLEVLTGFADTMTGDYELSDVLYVLTDEVVDVLGVTGVGIAVADDGNRLRCSTATNDAISTVERVQEEHQAGPGVDAFRTQQTVTVADISTRAEWPECRAAAAEHGVVAVAGLPLSLASERFGVLNLYDTRVREWSSRDLGAARILADMAAGYMVQARLRDTRRLADQLQVALENRVVIEQAKGVLVGQLGVPIDEAFERLRRRSRNTNISLRTLARQVVEEGYRLDEPDALVGQA